MGAIVAYFEAGGNPDVTDATHRQNGQKEFGQRLKLITGDLRDGLYTAIRDILSNQNFILQYEFLESNSADGSAKVEDLQTLGGNKLVLELEKTAVPESETPAAKVAHEVVLTVSSDGRENIKKKDKKVTKRAFRMAVTFPENHELDGFTYIDEVAQDVLDLDNMGEGGAYLTAFKLLSRCK